MEANHFDPLELNREAESVGIPAEMEILDLHARYAEQVDRQTPHTMDIQLNMQPEPIHRLIDSFTRDVRKMREFYFQNVFVHPAPVDPNVTAHMQLVYYLLHDKHVNTQALHSALAVCGVHVPVEGYERMCRMVISEMNGDNDIRLIPKERPGF